MIVVDNGSTDGSLEYLRDQHPEVTVREMGENTGFARAANQGLALARAELVALLNTDVVLAEDWLARMCGALQNAPGAAAAAGKMLCLDDPGRVYDAGDILRRDGACEQRGRYMRDDGRWDEPGEVFGACAGAALYRRSAVLAVGGFDERYFAYLEDVDLALRPAASRLELSLRARRLTPRRRRILAPAGRRSHVPRHPQHRPPGGQVVPGPRGCLWSPTASSAGPGTRCARAAWPPTSERWPRRCRCFRPRFGLAAPRARGAAARSTRRSPNAPSAGPGPAAIRRSWAERTLTPARRRPPGNPYPVGVPSMMSEPAAGERAGSVTCAWCGAQAHPTGGALARCPACGAATTYPVPSQAELELRLLSATGLPGDASRPVGIGC